MVLEEAIRNGLILCDKGMELLAGLSPFFHDGTGYWMVRASKRQYYVHRYVAEALIPNPGSYKCINHIDGDKGNNSASNLEWCTHSHNNTHAYAMGLKKPTWLGKSGKDHPCSGPVVGVNMHTGERVHFPSQGVAGISGFSQSKISLSVNGKRQSHKGYKWFIADDPRLSNQNQT